MKKEIKIVNLKLPQITEVFTYIGKGLFSLTRGEFKTDAGRANALFGLALIIIALGIFFRDTAFWILNFLLALISKRELPDLPAYYIFLFIVLVIGYFVWCVDLISKREKTSY